jgi:hypothetical protein
MCAGRGCRPARPARLPRAIRIRSGQARRVAGSRRERPSRPDGCASGRGRRGSRSAVVGAVRRVIRVHRRVASWGAGRGPRPAMTMRAPPDSRRSRRRPPGQPSTCSTARPGRPPARGHRPRTSRRPPRTRAAAAGPAVATACGPSTRQRRAQPCGRYPETVGRPGRSHLRRSSDPLRREGADRARVRAGLIWQICHRGVSEEGHTHNPPGIASVGQASVRARVRLKEMV